MSDTTPEEAHSGPIKTPKQLLLAVVLAFIVPVSTIIALVVYVVSDNKPAGSTQADSLMGGVTAQDLDRGVAERIRKVGTVEIRDASRALKSGEEVFKAQCTACHGAGVAGAPKFGDSAAWAPRIGTGFDTLVQSALKGKGAMPPQAGGDFDDTEVARGVAYMANAAGAKFPEPQPSSGAAAAAAAPASGTVQTAGPAGSASAAASAPSPGATPAAPPVPVAAAPQAAAAGAGEALYKQTCAVCHGAGVAGAPKFGDKAAWAPRIAQGVPALVQNAMKGKGAMPPKGGSSASEQEMRAAVEYMVNAAK